MNRTEVGAVPASDFAWFESQPGVSGARSNYHSLLPWLAMRVITALVLRRSLGRILDEASAGERFVIERDRRPLAVLVSVEEGQRLIDDPDARAARVDAALDRLAAIGDRLRERDPDAPDAATAIRLERERDNPGMAEDG